MQEFLSLICSRNLVRLQRGAKKFSSLRKKLFDLSCSFERQKECKNSHILSTISHLSSLSTLALRFSGNEGYEAIASKSLLKCLVSLKNLSSLDLYFAFVKFQDANIFGRLFKSLRKIPALTNLSLTFVFCFGLDSLHFSLFSAGLGKLTKLKTLKLFFGNLNELSDSSINILSSSFPKLPLLAKIDLPLQTNPIQSTTIVHLFIQFSKFKFLSDIKFNIHRTPILQANDGRDPAAEGLECLDFALIRRLGLSLSQDDLELKILPQVSRVLKRFNTLTTFDMYFDAKRNSHALELLEFSSSLCCLTSLTSLKLRFPYGLWSPDFMQKIAVTLESLSNLVQLLLDFGSSSVIEDSQFQTLFRNLRILKALKYLDLRFGSEGKITNKSLQILSQSLKELVLLHDLSFDSASASLFTNKGIEVLAGAIQSLKDLFGLTLNFGKNFNIDDEAVNALVQALKHLSYLFSFKMSISKSPYVTEFQGLIDALLGIKNLREIDLSLPNSNIRIYDPKCLIETKRIKAMVI